MPGRLRTATLGAVAVLCALIGFSGVAGGLTSSASAAVGARRVGASPALPRGAHRIGRLAATAGLSVDVALKPREPAALRAYAAAVSTPGSAVYRHYLTVSQLRRRFAPTAAQVASLRTALRASGLAPSAVSANGLLIHVHASAARLATAFHTSFAQVKLANGQTAYANERAPQFSAAVADLVQGVVGLNDLATPHALGLARAKGVGDARANARQAAETAHAVSAPAPCSAASSTAASQGAYTADEIASAYGFNTLYADNDFGAGQTVALLEFEEYSSADIAGYESCYGIDSDVSTEEIDGGVGSSYQGGPSGSGEAALDIEQVVGLAPGAAVDVYEAPDTEQGELDAFDAMLENSSVRVISTSWGECEYAENESYNGEAQAEADLFEELAAAGKSVYAASGDAGSTDCDGTVRNRSQAAALAVDDPGSQPDVTDVGGTTLPSDSDPAGQTAWDESSIANGAGGGGISLDWTMPSYQSDAVSALGVISGDSSAGPCDAAAGSFCREVPDVSADADPQTGYLVYYEGSWAAIGGTSGAAPLWAAISALANASSFCDAKAIGFANPVLYQVAGEDYASAFTDVTSGTNDYTPSGYDGGLYPAGTGYDMATGLGTPNVGTLVPDMCADVAGSKSSTGAGTGSPTPTGTTPATPTPPPSTTPVKSPPTTPTVTAPATTPTVTTPLTTATTPTTATPATSACAKATVWLFSTARSIVLSKNHRSKKLSFALDLTPGCIWNLSLQRHISTSERRGAKALDTLKFELLNRTGTLLRTLSTLSNANAQSGYQTLKLNLSRDAGEKLTLELLATRKGPKTTTFTLRSAAVSRS